MKAKRKPCPFCEHEKTKLVVRFEDGFEDHVVTCRKCGGSGPTCRNPDAAVRYWNARTKEQS